MAGRKRYDQDQCGDDLQDFDFCCCLDEVADLLREIADPCEPVEVFTVGCCPVPGNGIVGRIIVCNSEENNCILRLCTAEGVCYIPVNQITAICCPPPPPPPPSTENSKKYNVEKESD